MVPNLLCVPKPDPQLPVRAALPIYLRGLPVQKGQVGLADVHVLWCGVGVQLLVPLLQKAVLLGKWAEGQYSRPLPNNQKQTPRHASMPGRCPSRMPFALMMFRIPDLGGGKAHSKQGLG